MIRFAFLGDQARADRYAAVLPRVAQAKIEAVIRSPDQSDPPALGAKVVSLDDLLSRARDAIDAVIVTSSVKAPLAMAKQIAQSGLHVLLELSNGISSEAIEELLEASERSNAILMPGQTSRFLPSAQVAWETLQSGKLGRPGLVRIHQWQGLQSPMDSRYGMLSAIDLAVWLFANPPTEVYALTASKEHLQLHLGFPEGGMALIDTARLPSRYGYRSFSLIGSRGAVYADDHHNMQLLYREQSPIALPTEPGPQALLAELREFVDAIEQKRQPLVSGADIYCAIQVVEAMEASMASHQALHRKGEQYVPV